MVRGGLGFEAGGRLVAEEMVRGGQGVEAGSRRAAADSLRGLLSSAIKTEDMMEARRASE